MILDKNDWIVIPRLAFEISFPVVSDDLLKKFKSGKKIRTDLSYFFHEMEIW
jgi:hypothetical protein